MMPRPRPPPTPASSTDIAAQHQQSQFSDMESSFALPPPAVTSDKNKSTAKGHAKSRSRDARQPSPPSSPEDRSNESNLQRKRTLSGASKSPLQGLTMASTSQAPSHDLPPPPSRARKIIQMKPKQSPTMNAQDQASSVTSSTSKQSSSQSTTTGSKKSRSQPGPTTAAGRKIARKTAHSIIERRRRSKMNEEFGVLKDMIPACTGVEMHKLAILQAGIEYLRYLEGCIDKLKDRNEKLEATLDRNETDEHDDDMDVDAEVHDDHSISRPSSTAVTEDSISSMHAPPVQLQQRQQYSHTPSSQTSSAANSVYPSPNLRPVSSSTSIYHAAERHTGQSHSGYSILPPISTHSKSLQAPSYTVNNSVPGSPLSLQPPPGPASARGQGQPFYNTTPTATPFGTLATGISPAIHAFHFSPDMTRPSTYASSTPGTSISISSITGHPSMDGKHSPLIAPLPQAALPLPTPSSRTGGGNNSGEKHGAAEANATAALLMMGNDRRASLAESRPPSENGGNSTPGKSASGKGMSVKDLLSS